ncbi:MAG: O-antigen ligase family protein [Chloroflexi bacterium]|nr:O-antigen ligase family protein [Chloroflexota bacterium]
MSVAGWAERPRTNIWSAPVLATVFSMVVLALAIAFLPPFWALVTLVGIALLVVVLVRPELGLWLLVFSVPYGSWRELAIGTLELTATEVLVAATLVGWLAAKVRSGSFKHTTPPLFVPLLAFIGLIVFSVTYAASLPPALKELFKWLEVLIVYVIIADVVQTRRQVLIFVALLFAAASSEALLGFFQFFTKYGPDSFAVDRFLRAYGTFGQPNPYAGYLATIAALAYSSVLASSQDVKRWPGGGARVGTQGGSLGASPWFVWFAWACLAVSLLAILMSLSRGAWLGLGAMLAVVGAFGSRRALFVLVVIAVVLALVFLVGLLNLLPAQMVDRVSDTMAYFGVFDVTEVQATPQNWPIVERMASWQTAWRMYEDSPLLGVGIGNYVESYRDFSLPGWNQPKGHAHNFYLNVLAEMGIVGLLAYLLLLVCFLGHAYRVVTRLAAPGGREDLKLERALAIGLLGALAVLLVHNIFDNLFVHSIGVQMGLFLGLLFVLDRLGRRRVSMGVEGI